MPAGKESLTDSNSRARPLAALRYSLPRISSGRIRAPDGRVNEPRGSDSRVVGNTVVEPSLLVVAQVESNSIVQSSQVHTIADYAKLALSGYQPIMLASPKS